MMIDQNVTSVNNCTSFVHNFPSSETQAETNTRPLTCATINHKKNSHRRNTEEPHSHNTAAYIAKYMLTYASKCASKTESLLENLYKTVQTQLSLTDTHVPNSE
jgi:hypothetical protein